MRYRQENLLSEFFVAFLDSRRQINHAQFTSDQ